MRSPVDPGRARPTRCCCSPPASTLILAGADDLLVVAVGFLLASIPLYGLIRITRTPLGAEAAMKTYLLGALSGILLLTGVTLLYGMSTTTSYAELPDRLADAPAGVVAAGVVAVLGGLLFKAGGAPGLFWVPDAAQGAGGAVAAFLTTVPKVGSVIAAYRLLAILPDTLAWPLLVALLAVGSMTLGNLTRLLADRPAAPAGLVHGQRGGLPVGAGRGRRTQRPRAALAAAYLAGYTVPNLSAFAVTTAFPQRRELRSYRGMGRTHPWLGAALVVALLGLGGTPPTVVFVGKLTTTAAVWDAGYAWLAVLVPSTPSSASSTTCAVSRSSTPVPRHPGHQDHAATPGRWSRTTAIATAALSLVLVIGAGALWPPSHCDSSPKHRPSPVSPREGARPPTMTNGSHFSPARAGSGRDLCPPGLRSGRGRLPGWPCARPRHRHLRRTRRKGATR